MRLGWGKALRKAYIAGNAPAELAGRSTDAYDSV